MKEFLDLLKRFDIKGIMVNPTKNGFLKFFRYAFVGGIATIVDWGALYVLTEYFHIHPMVSAVISFVLGLIVNYALSKLLVFKADQARVNGAVEFIGYAVIGVIGLGITELIMYLFWTKWGCHYMLAKVFATAVVLAWNYLARAKIIYKQ